MGFVFIVLYNEPLCEPSNAHAFHQGSCNGTNPLLRFCAPGTEFPLWSFYTFSFLAAKLLFFYDIHNCYLFDQYTYLQLHYQPILFNRAKNNIGYRCSIQDAYSEIKSTFLLIHILNEAHGESTAPRVTMVCKKYPQPEIHTVCTAVIIISSTCEIISYSIHYNLSPITIACNREKDSTSILHFLPIISGIDIIKETIMIFSVAPSIILHFVITQSLFYCRRKNYIIRGYPTVR